MLDPEVAFWASVEMMMVTNSRCDDACMGSTDAEDQKVDGSPRTCHGGYEEDEPAVKHVAGDEQDVQLVLLAGLDGDAGGAAEEVPSRLEILQHMLSIL